MLRASVARSRRIALSVLLAARHIRCVRPCFQAHRGPREAAAASAPYHLHLILFGSEVLTLALAPFEQAELRLLCIRNEL